MVSGNRRPGQGRAPKLRWECACVDPPILLARYDPGGKVQIKIRDRYYIASGCVHATCPRCGAQHILDLRPDSGAAGGNGHSTPPIPAAGGWW